MERNYRRFKRTVHKNEYGIDFKKRMDIRMFKNKRQANAGQFGSHKAQQGENNPLFKFQQVGP